jgi:hypothetical protein
MSLNSCEEHDSCIVVHDSSRCPFCEANTMARQAEGRAEGLEDEVRKLEDEITELGDQDDE